MLVPNHHKPLVLNLEVLDQTLELRVPFGRLVMKDVNPFFDSLGAVLDVFQEVG